MKLTNFIALFCFCSTSLIAQVYPGETYFDTNGYVEYIAGNLPIILSAPHGGYLEPATIPDRDCSGCVYVRDSYTQELTREITAAIVEKTGCYPHVVINLLHRKKFDANRDIGDAADGNATVESSWYSYHDFLDLAKVQVAVDYDRAIFYDMHGHGHAIQRIELGYTLSKSELQLDDTELNTDTYIEESSIQTLVGDNIQSLTHAELLRGSASLGTLLEDRGYPAVPSMQDPFPLDNESYFSGGYNTQRHGSLDGGHTDGIQIECNQDVRFVESVRQAFADSLAELMLEYYVLHYNGTFDEGYCNLASSLDEWGTEEQVRIFPNPVVDYLQLEGVKMGTPVSIYNTLGQQVHYQLYNGNPIDLSTLLEGIYFLRFEQTGKAIRQQTLIKISK